MKILIADDNRPAADAMADKAKSWGHEVQVVYNGRECMEKLNAGIPIDALVLDMSMPGLNGSQVLAEIARWPKLPKFKVIVTTAYLDWQTEFLKEDVRKTLGLPDAFPISDISNPELVQGLVVGDLDKSEGFE